MHCNANLQVHRSDGGTFTEAVERLTETADSLAQQVENLAERNELAELDRRWEIERRSFMIPSKGAAHLPTPGFAWAAGIVAILFGGLWTILAISITQSAPNVGPFAVAKVVFPLFGLVFIGFGVFNAISAYRLARSYRDSERNYWRRRDELTRED